MSHKDLKTRAPERPEKGDGSRKLDCDLYDTCLDLAAKKNWDNFHCEDCTYETDQANGKDAGGTNVPGNAKALCGDCLDKETLGGSPLCASCLGIRGNKAKAVKAKNKATEKPKKRKGTKGQPRGKKTPNEAGTALRVDFGKHVSILREVEHLAGKEIRSVENQVVYMLKKQLAREKEARAS